jgi:hypothetical protein
LNHLNDDLVSSKLCPRLVLDETAPALFLIASGTVHFHRFVDVTDVLNSPAPLAVTGQCGGAASPSRATSTTADTSSSRGRAESISNSLVGGRRSSTRGPTPGGSGGGSGSRAVGQSQRSLQLFTAGPGTLIGFSALAAMTASVAATESGPAEVLSAVSAPTGVVRLLTVPIELLKK